MGTARDAEQPDDGDVDADFGFDDDVDEVDDVDDDGGAGDEGDGELGAPVVSVMDRCRGTVVGDAVIAMLTVDPKVLGDSALLAEAESILAAQRVLAAAAYRIVGAAVGRGVHLLDGNHSAKAWIASKAGMTSTDAFGVARTATSVGRHALLSDGLADGSVSATTAELIGKLDGSGRQALLDEQLAMLLEVAAGQFHADDVAAVFARWKALADECLDKGDPALRYAKRRLSLASTFAGTMVVSGILTPEAGATVMAALEALIEPDPADCPEGPRTREQLMADALVEMAGRFLRSGGTFHGDIDDEGDDGDTGDETGDNGSGEGARRRSGGGGGGGPIVGVEIIADLHTIARLTHDPDHPDAEPHDCADGFDLTFTFDPADHRDQGPDHGTDPAGPDADIDPTGADRGSPAPAGPGPGPGTGAGSGSERSGGSGASPGGGSGGGGDGGSVAYPLFSPSRERRRYYRDWLRSLTPAQLAAMTCDISGAGAVSPSVLAMLLCDCRIGSTALGATGQIVSIAATTSTWTPAQRRAITARDSHCTWPDCRLPARWCDIDHIQRVHHHGPTRTDNGRCLCRHHHTLRHLGWDLVIDPLPPPGPPELHRPFGPATAYYAIPPPEHPRHLALVTELNRRRHAAQARAS